MLKTTNCYYARQLFCINLVCPCCVQNGFWRSERLDSHL